jgi:hypothetical protein
MRNIVIIIIIIFSFSFSGCSSQNITKEEKQLHKQIKKLKVEDIKRMRPIASSEYIHNEKTLDQSQILDINITPKNNKVKNNYIEAALSVWDYLYSLDNKPIKIGTVRVFGTGDVFFAEVAEKYVVISRDQYEVVKDLPRTDAYKYFPIYEGSTTAQKRSLPYIEGFCNDEEGQKFKQAYTSILKSLKNGQFIDFVEKDQYHEGIYWFFSYEVTKQKQEYSNYSIWNDDHSSYSVGIYDEKTKQILDIKIINNIKDEVKDWLKLKKGEFISDVDYTYFSNYLNQDSDYLIEYWISNKEGNTFVQIPIGLQVEDKKIKLVQKEQ